MTIEILKAIDAEIAKLQQARAILTDYSAAKSPEKKGPGRPKKGTSSPPVKVTKKRVLSEEARAKIAAGQKRRWARSKRGAK